MRPLSIALAGLDGVGKTSLASALAESSWLLDAGWTVTVVPRGPADVERKFEALLPRRFEDHRDWLDPEFNRAIALACAVDYVDYHRTLVAPRLDRLGRRDLVVLDRHAICFRAFARIVTPPSTLAMTLLASVSDPDLVAWVGASPDTVARRLRARPGPIDPFEHPEAQSALGKAYEQELAAFADRTIRIDNDEALEVVAERLAKRIIARVLDLNATR